MLEISYARHHYPPSVIQRAVRLYLRFSLSLRDVEGLPAERGLDLSYETVRRWVLEFGRAYARTVRRRLTPSCDRWHLAERCVSIGGRRMYLWRAVDAEGEVLDILVQSRRDKRGAKKLIRKRLRKQGVSPRSVVTDKLRSYGAALRAGREATDFHVLDHAPAQRADSLVCHGSVPSAETMVGDPQSQQGTDPARYRSDITTYRNKLPRERFGPTATSWPCAAPSATVSYEW